MELNEYSVRYLILHDGDAFYTEWFSLENNYLPGMVVFDLTRGVFTSDGKSWSEINIDHL